MEAKIVEGIFKGTKGAVKRNSNGKEYMWCTVNIDGKDFPAMMYEKSLNCTTVGDAVKAELREVGEVVMITVFNPSLLSTTPLPTVEDFAYLFVKMDV
jgi:hypothetical protein